MPAPPPPLAGAGRHPQEMGLIRGRRPGCLKVLGDFLTTCLSLKPRYPEHTPAPAGVAGTAKKHGLHWVCGLLTVNVSPLTGTSVPKIEGGTVVVSSLWV